MRRHRLLVGVLLLGATLSGCGGDPVPDRVASPSLPATAAATSTPEEGSPSPIASPAVSPGSTKVVRMTGEGVDTPARLVEFGTPYKNARAILDPALGAPTKDTGEVDSFSDYGTCPGATLRALEYGGGALVLLFGDVDGPGLTFYQWALEDRGTPADVPQASALIGDVTTYDFGVGTTVAQLREGVGEALQVTAGDDRVAPSFRLTDQSSRIFGQLTGTGPRDTALLVEAGESCGE